MRRHAMFSMLAAALLAAGCAYRDPAEVVLRQAEQAMGGAHLKTLHYAGSGTGSSFGQAWQPGMAWPRVRLTNYQRWVDYDGGVLREDSALSRAEPTGGGALPAVGEQRSSAWLMGAHAWNMIGPAPAAAPSAVTARIHDLWTTPHGVVKAGLRNKPTLRMEGETAVVSFTEPGRFKASVWVGSDGLVRRIDSVLPHPVTGDTPVVTLFGDWRDHDGLKFPRRIAQHQGGFPVMDLEVTLVQPNAPAAAEVPALVASFAEKVDPQKVADGVWFLAGGSHNSVLIEFADHLMLVESPLYDGRAQAVWALARQLVPAKPVRFVVNSHHHFDHAGGLRAAAAEGATLVVSEQARPWFQRTFGVPNSVRPDALAESGRKPVFLGVNGQRSFADAVRSAEIYLVEDSVHAQGFMMVWLPKERLLIQADAFTPAAPNALSRAEPDANHLNLLANIERLQLDVDRILPLHGRVVPMAQLRAATARKP